MPCLTTLIFASLIRLLSGAGMLEGECFGDSATCDVGQAAELFLLARAARRKHVVRPSQSPLPTTRQDAAQAPPRKNIAMIYLDQWRWDWAGFDDAIDVHMPTVKMLARRGTRFDHAYVPSPLCVPSRCAMAAGRNYQEMWAKNNGFDYGGANAEASTTFMQLLQQAGYTTMMAGQDHLSALSGTGKNGSVHAKELGFDLFIRAMGKYEFCALGMALNFQAPSAVDQYGVYLTSTDKWEGQCRMYGPYARGAGCNMTQVCADGPGGLQCGFNCQKFNPIDEEDSIDAWVERSAEELLSTHWSSESKKEPWFLELGFPSPHPPFIASHRAYTDYGAKKNFPPPIDAHFDRSTPQAQHVDTLASQREYAAMLGQVDMYLEKFTKFLQSNGQFDNTVIVLLSDHGEFLGDHAQYAKEAAWEQAVRVPLIFSGPGIAQNRLVNAPVATLDVAGTILDIAGTQPIDVMQTQSLLPAIQPFSILKPNRSVILSGLDTEFGHDFMGRSGGFAMALKQFNETCILKLVCCLTGCIKQGTMFPTTDDIQVVLMRVEPGAGAARYEHNVLDLETGTGVAEANELLQSLGAAYRSNCSAKLRV